MRNTSKSQDVVLIAYALEIYRCYSCQVMKDVPFVELEEALKVLFGKNPGAKASLVISQWFKEEDFVCLEALLERIGVPEQSRKLHRPDPDDTDDGQDDDLILNLDDL